MEIDKRSSAFQAALNDFHRARQRAVLMDVLASLTGKSDDLLAYDQVYEQLTLGEPVERGLQEIPLAAIVGSVGRYADFNRSFLPRSKNDARRWAEVKAAITERGHIPPIIVYKIDQVYFVLDGNHRVSIARQRGDSHISAYVTEIPTDVPLSPEVQPDELICKARYADFLARYPLPEVRPEADLSVTAPGHYRLLEEQIERHRHRLSEQSGRAVADQETVQSWYETVYLPVVQIIRQRGILHHFPGRTETDLYGWILQHQAELREEVGWEVDPEDVADDLIEHFSYQPQQLIKRITTRLREAITPEPFEAGPPPGQWRETQIAPQQREQLFADILVAITGEKANWAGVSQALVVAQREGGRLHGLHVVGSALAKDNRHSYEVQARFQHLCQQAEVPGEVSVEIGKVTRTICDRARWTDLVVIHLTHLPRPEPSARLLSRFGTLVRRCPRPVLAVPGHASPLSRALLAYDGSPKANEALFVAAYLAGKWQIPLTVVTVLEEGHTTSDTLKAAQEYLEGCGVQATFISERGTIAWAIIRAAQLYECDFIIMGGYGFNPVLEVMLGSEVDQILRAEKWPVLICR